MSPVSTPARPRVRRSQAERSAETRERLLDATLECLAARGWAGTTTTEVAERAGVSRGAQLHHFPTRAELVAAAVAHLAERRLAEFAAAVAALPEDADVVQAGLERLWRMFSDPSGYALLELVVAARTDGELRRSLEPVARRLDERFEQVTGELFPEALHRSSRLATLRSVIFLLLQGLAVQRIVLDDPARRREVLEFARRLAWDTFAAIGEEHARREGRTEKRTARRTERPTTRRTKRTERR